MAYYKLTKPAERDFFVIWKNIATDDTRAADGVLDYIENQCETLAASPRIGRIRKEFSPDLFIFPSKKASWRSSYMIFYRITGYGIEVIRVIEGHREITPELFE